MERELTEREREVAILAAQGNGPKELCAALNLSYGTVKAHLQRIYFKMGISGHNSAAQLAARAGELLGEAKQ